MTESVTAIIARVPPGVNPFPFIMKALHSQVVASSSSPEGPIVYN
jgi:hypothetical protein